MLQDLFSLYLRMEVCVCILVHNGQSRPSETSVWAKYYFSLLISSQWCHCNLLKHISTELCRCPCLIAPLLYRSQRHALYTLQTQLEMHCSRHPTCSYNYLITNCKWPGGCSDSPWSLLYLGAAPPLHLCLISWDSLAGTHRTLYGITLSGAPGMCAMHCPTHSRAAHAVCQACGSPAARPACPGAPCAAPGAQRAWLPEALGRPARWRAPGLPRRLAAAGDSLRPPGPVTSGAQRPTPPKRASPALSSSRPPTRGLPLPVSSGRHLSRPAPAALPWRREAPPRRRRPGLSAAFACGERASGRAAVAGQPRALPAAAPRQRKEEAPWPSPGPASRRRSCGACGASAQVRTATGLWRGPGLETGTAAAPAPVGGGQRGRARRGAARSGGASGPSAPRHLPQLHLRPSPQPPYRHVLPSPQRTCPPRPLRIPLNPPHPFPQSCHPP